MMRTTDSGRRGSALLIVLGMFSFMLVSAVAFSVYMRSSRAPSSYVRRNASARHLVKAALARAMDEIDTAIGNDPFPGIGYNHDYNAAGNRPNDKFPNDSYKRDIWHGHVFTPSSDYAVETNANSTVSTLTLEALGYLPPCLIDEVRYWSRHTSTARWRSFNYGLGQYAFTAVNVSDFFDLNQLIDTDGVAKQRLNRNSSPMGRISPTYLFRSSDTGDMDKNGADAAAFLSAMASGSGLGATPSPVEVPFVSMLDFNLALGTKKLGEIASPFMNRLMGQQGKFYNSGNSTEDIVRRQVFIAGGWNGSSNITASAYEAAGTINLGFPEFQPFYNCGWAPDGTTLSGIFRSIQDNPFRSGFDTPMYEMPFVTMAMLCDYLDYDSVPLSLCIPSTEPVPMLCGVKLDPPAIKTEGSMEEKSEVDASDPQNPKTIITRTYTMKVTIPTFAVTLTTAFPFKDPVPPNGGDYTADLVARVFLSANTGNAWAKGLRGGGSDPNIDWNGATTWPQSGPSGAASYQQVSVEGKGITANGAAADATEASTVRGNRLVLMDWQPMTFSATFVYKDSVDPANLQSPPVCQSDIEFFDENWGKISLFAELKKTLGVESGAPTPFYFQPSVAVWARIRSGADTVDMVPAVPACDGLNGHPENATDGGFANKFAIASGAQAGNPLLRFFPKKEDADAVQIGTFFPATPGTVARESHWDKTAYVANDPRLNWAPEQWWLTDGDPNAVWLAEVHNFQSGRNWCDLDIFMGASNQGYLQSMYELMMIPQVQRLGATANPLFGMFENPGSTDYDGEVNTVIGDVSFADLMWRTYRADAFYRVPADRSIANLPGSTDPKNWGSLDDVRFVEPENGLRVNPYTDITNIMLGAFANMPCNWWSASTNFNAQGKNYMRGTSFENSYLFNWSCRYRDCAYDMAAYWMKAFRGEGMSDSRSGEWLYGASNWMKVFDDTEHIFDWSTGEFIYNAPGNVDIAKLRALTDPGGEIGTAVDRKFLYGYLKGCFANTAQLFLVFVRAESAAGGGGAGSGARAVALVWRDPNAPMDNSGKYKTASGGAEEPERGKDNAQKYLNVTSGRSEESWRLNARLYPPHKMRVLFYHQLD